MSAAMPAEYVDAFFSFFADGTLDESKVLPTVQELTGRPARTFRQWPRTRRGIPVGACGCRSVSCRSRIPAFRLVIVLRYVGNTHETPL
jgi:hypothetical protein